MSDGGRGAGLQVQESGRVGAARRPAEATAQDGLRLRVVMLFRHVAEGGIKDPALAETALEDDRHDDAGGAFVVLAGESGSGKSVTNLSVMRLIPEPPGQIAGGKIAAVEPNIPASKAKKTKSNMTKPSKTRSMITVARLELIGISSLRLST